MRSLVRISVIFLVSLFSPSMLGAQPSGHLPILAPVPIRKVAPAPLPHVKPAYEEARFWIARQAEPEKIILNAGDIEELNRKSLKSDPEAVDIFSLPAEVNAEPLRAKLLSDRERYEKEKLFDLTGRPFPADYFQRIFSRMNIGGIPPSVRPVYGIVTRQTHLRTLPSDDLAMDKPFDFAFDRFQSEKLDCATPVIILHYTGDRSWCYVDTGCARGWAKPNDIAVGDRGAVATFAAAKPLVVTGDTAAFYRDPELRQFAFDLPMGAKLPYAGTSGDRCRVLLPLRDPQGGLKVVEGYVKSGPEVNAGYLPYTMQSVLSQAFRLRDSRYSWGGSVEGRDCSRFIRDVFRCFGFRMPRDSYRQARFDREHSENVAGWEEARKIDLMRRCDRVPTLLYMRGHIMLLLGVVEDRAYAIHSYWEYSRDEQPEIIYHVGRVAVTDLSLGKSGEGTLLKWITEVVPIR